MKNISTHVAVKVDGNGVPPSSKPRSLVLPAGQNTPALGQSPVVKIFVFTEILFWRRTRNIPARHKGRFAIVTIRRPGCGGRDGVGARVWLQGGKP